MLGVVKNCNYAGHNLPMILAEEYYLDKDNNLLQILDGKAFFNLSAAEAYYNKIIYRREIFLLKKEIIAFFSQNI